jgi:hypothetical protein
MVESAHLAAFTVITVKMAQAGESEAGPLMTATPMEVAQFSSALTYSGRSGGPQWLIASGSRNVELPLPDGTTLGISVKVTDVSELQSSDYITIHAWLNRTLIDDAEHGNEGATHGQQNDEGDRKASRRPLNGLLRTEAFPLAMQCRPPKPRYKSPNEEPDDNSLGQRSLRYAFAHLDLDAITSAWSTEEKATLAWVQLYIMVNMLPAEEAFNVAIDFEPSKHDMIESLLVANLLIPHPIASPKSAKEPAMFIFQRSTFWQNAFPFRHHPWLYTFGSRAPVDARYAVPALPLMTVSSGTYHPVRPRKPKASEGPLYTRHILELGQTLTFEPISSKDEEFVRLFTKWHNQDRVANGWRQRGTEQAQQSYLAGVEESASTLGLVGKWDGEPWGYVEIYWAKESNVGAYYDAADYDRGFHALVGEDRFRGSHRVRSWMGSVFHMLFTLDPRTQRVILEPRASNQKMISYTTMCGGHVEKLIDLPHKRAALVICPRERFFQLCPLGPLTVSGSSTSSTTGAAQSSSASSAKPFTGRTEGGAAKTAPPNSST